MPYTFIDDQVFILVADHKIDRSRGWGSFGGCVESNESIEDGALRELHEETRCALDANLKITSETAQATIGKFTSFALKIAYIDGEAIQQNTLSGICAHVVLAERGPWSWIALEKLLSQPAVVGDRNLSLSKELLPGASNPRFWSKSLQIIRALADIEAFK